MTVRTSRGTRSRNEMNGIDARGRYIVCSVCGKMHLRSMTTDSILYCPKCGAKAYVSLKNDIIIKIPAALLDGEGARETLKNANQELQQLWYAPICDYYPEETVQHSNS